MLFHADVAVRQLNKHGEELCGDHVNITRTADDTFIVLSDGLGSGVKANILATLTTKIASSMCRKGIAMEDVVATITETLPVCRQRKIAYSTLHLLHLQADGQAKIVEFDCPQTFLYRDGVVIPVPTEEKEIAGRLVREGSLRLVENDLLVAVSDGVIHAGIGGLLNLGWGWEGIAEQLRQIMLQPGRCARDVSQGLISCCEGYYTGKPGDDSTVVAVRLHPPRCLTLMAGPPQDRRADSRVVWRLLSQTGKKAVAGGTTARIVSRIAGRELRVLGVYEDPQIPPTGKLDGIDLVTEGLLTLNAVGERLLSEEDLRISRKRDGATLLAQELLQADRITILAGKALNEAHAQALRLPFQVHLKSQVLQRLAGQLEAMGKTVVLEWF